MILYGRKDWGRVQDCGMILIVDSDDVSRLTAVQVAVRLGYDARPTPTADELVERLGRERPALAIVEVELPGAGNGLDVMRQLHETFDDALPVILVSARQTDAFDRTAGIMLGADDYLTKPFSVGELLARIRVALRHRDQGDETPPVFEAGGLRVDLARRVVERDGKEVHLTPTEYKLLAVLVKHAGKVLTHRQLLLEVWGSHSTQQTQALRVYVTQLRHKIEADPARPRLLSTEPGVGYRLRDTATD
jgi:two-component system KDP operon response regulator KdpE